MCCISSCENIKEGKRCQEKCALVVGPVRGERPVDGRGGLHVGPVGGSNPAHKLLFVHVPGVPVGVRQAYIRVHNELGVAQTQVVVAQERALRGCALALLVAPAGKDGSCLELASLGWQHDNILVRALEMSAV